MCLVVISTKHPNYAYVLISNRDEFLSRKTLPADWWAAPHEHVLGGRDLQRETQGTWLGITRQGRLAILTNYREENQEVVEGARSRGEIAKAYLTIPPGSTETPEQFTQRIVEKEGVQGVGGFSLMFGQSRKALASGKRAPLAVISNRTPDAKGVQWVAGGEPESIAQACALSNTQFGDREWPKVVDGEALLGQTIDWSVSHKVGEAELIDRCFATLSVDTLPKPKPGQNWQVFARELRNSIFIPSVGGQEVSKTPADALAAAESKKALKASDGIYGTQKQTVLLVDHSGRVVFTERTLYDNNAQRTSSDNRERRFEFQIEGWGG